MMRWTLAASLPLAVAACASGGGHGLEGAREIALYERLSGTWILNREESTSLADAMRGARPDRRTGGPRPGGMRGGGRGGGMGPPGGRGGRGPQGESSDGGPGTASLEPDTALAVTVGARGVELAGGVLTTLEAPTTDEAVVLPRLGRAMEVRAKWDGPVLSIERSLEEGPKIVDLYEAADGSRLIVRRKIESPRGPDMELVLVYDRASPSP